eukprot:g6178.t1
MLRESLASIVESNGITNKSLHKRNGSLLIWQLLQHERLVVRYGKKDLKLLPNRTKYDITRAWKETYYIDKKIKKTVNANTNDNMMHDMAVDANANNNMDDDVDIAYEEIFRNTNVSLPARTPSNVSIASSHGTLYSVEGSPSK